MDYPQRRRIKIWGTAEVIEDDPKLEQRVSDPEYPARPKVQCLNKPNGERFEHPSLEEIDLAFYPELEIACVDGQDVRGFTASLEEDVPAPALV